MATRTNRLIGKVWGDPANPATLVVNYNGQEVFNGTVNTTAGDPNTEIDNNDMEILCSWTGDSSVHGSIPTSITVTNGTAAIRTITMNECRQLDQAVEKSDAVWPAYHPTTAYEVHQDKKTLSEADFVAKYGAPSSIAYTNYDVTSLVSKSDNYMIPNAAGPGNDNKIDVVLDGTPWTDDSGNLNGIRSYGIPSGSTLTFNYSVIIEG
jgi:hypothetical protein